MFSYKKILFIGYFNLGEYGDMLLTAQPDDEHGIARPPSEEEVLEVYQRYFGDMFCVCIIKISLKTFQIAVESSKY